MAQTGEREGNDMTSFGKVGELRSWGVEKLERKAGG